MSIPWDYLTFMLYSLPGSLVWLVGAIVAVVTWKRHPTVSLMALLSCLLMLFNALAGNTVQYWLIHQRASAGWSQQDLSFKLTLLSVVRVVLGAISGILILCAVFSGRRGMYQPPALDVAVRTPPRESDDIQRGQRWS